MDARRLLRKLAVAALTVLWLAGSAAAAYGAVDNLLERQLTTSPADQTYAQISGRRVVYIDDRSGFDQIYAFDLSTGIETQVSTSAAGWPDAYGDKVVYSSDSGIYCYDLVTGVGRRITPDDTIAAYPAISGNRVVYSDNRSGYQNIYCYDLRTGAESRLTSVAATQVEPAISGNRVIYEDRRNGTQDIYCYDFSTKAETPLVTGPEDQFAAAISGTNVTYQTGSPDWSIYYLDLRTGESTLVAGFGDYPDVSGSKVVYSSGSEVFCYDTESHVTRSLNNDAPVQFAPAIDGNNVVYQDNRSGNWDIYLGELAVPNLTAKAAASTIGWNKTTTISGSLTTIGGIPLANRIVEVEASPDGITWTAMRIAVTGATGSYSVLSPELTSACYLRANYIGGGDYFSSQSAPVLVRPQAKLGTPETPSTMYRVRTYAVTGYMHPTHALGSTVGTLYCYRLESGRWRLRRTFTLKSALVSGRPSYKTSAKLPYAGKWRMRAYHSDAGHAPTYSAWRLVTVK